MTCDRCHAEVGAFEVESHNEWHDAIIGFFKRVTDNIEQMTRRLDEQEDEIARLFRER